ncbi:MAG TPA: hypothetical protein VIH61_01710 [Waddliaceae bacterium]
MAHLNFASELCLPYKRAVAYGKNLEDIEDNCKNYFNPHRYPAVVAL